MEAHVLGPILCLNGKRNMLLNQIDRPYLQIECYLHKTHICDIVSLHLRRYMIKDSIIVV